MIRGNFDIVIGIDPDCEKSGMGIVLTDTKQVQVKCMPFPELIDEVSRLYHGYRKMGKTAAAVVEAGWMHKSNWHLKRKDNQAIAAKIGNATGRNHETGRKIVEMLRYKGVEVDTILPLRKCWRGKDGKITSEELSYIIGSKLPRCNQDGRDAVLLAWTYANLPIKIHV